MVPPRTAAPFVALAAWLGVAALGLALAARAAIEPPVWDALSYAQKAFNFWQAVGAGALFNPFDVPMTLRPPGTILMSYPFGWSDDFRWFYFRSSFIPMLLLTASVFIAGWSRTMTRTEAWALAGCALVLAGMPAHYQFQATETLPVSVNWGLVDGFLAGVAAVAAAAVLRSVRLRSVGWAVGGAMAAAFCFWIKPTGLAMMGLAGLAWLLLLGAAVGWNFAVLKNDQPLRRYAFNSFLAAGVIFAAATLLAVKSEYFSAENVAFGQRALAVLEAEYVSRISPGVLGALVIASFGYALPVLTLAAFAVALRPGAHRPAACAALICLAVGLWFWLAQTDASQIRYFLPFGVMAFVLLIPALLAWVQTLPPKLAFGGGLASVAPALLITGALFLPAPSQALQRALGINLHTSDHQAETAQAAEVLALLNAEGRSAALIYATGTSPALRSLQAVWDYAKLAEPGGVKISVLIPTDWQRLSTVRIEDILRCDFIALQPASDSAAVLAQHEVADFAGLIRLINAWMATLTEDEGVVTVSQTSVRILRITDRARFEAAVARLEQSYALPQVYRDANPQRWWSPEEVSARIGGEPPVKDIAFAMPDSAEAVRRVRAGEVVQNGDSVRASFWIESDTGDTLPGPWHLFAHLVDGAGQILGNAQIELLSGVPPSPDRPLRYYSVTYPARVPGAAAIAFGIFRINTPQLDYLMAGAGTRDWDGRRVIVPLPSR